MRIRGVLDEAKLETLPDFEGEYIDGLIEFHPLTEAPTPAIPTRPDHSSNSTEPTVSGTPNDGGTAPILPDSFPPNRAADPTHRIGRLASANTKPVSVQPDAPLAEAVTLMLQSDYSQLPIMTNERTVKGLVSWKSIGSRLALRQVCEKVKDCQDEYQEISADRSIFEAIRIIVEHDCVLVRDGHNKITGIVTAADISTQYDQLAGPFLLLGEIENQIRTLMTGKLTGLELEQAKDPADTTRTITDASDLSFGEYVRLLGKPEIWTKMELPIDRKSFIMKLDKVREIRNDVMHFDPDGIGPDETKELREFTAFLGRLRKLLNR